MTSPAEDGDRRMGASRLEHVLGDLRSLGCDLTLLGLAELGETAGAAFVAWPDGREGVLTVSALTLARARQTGEVLQLARERGIPVPRYHLVTEIDSGVVVLQDRLPGHDPRVVEPETVEAIVAANEGLAGVLSERPDVPHPTLMLGPDLSRNWREPMVAHSDRSRRLLQRIQRVTPPKTAPGDDLVHPDLTVSNVLIDDAETVTGIVDWNDGALRGDRHFALVKLLFDLTWEAAAPGGGRHRVHASALARLTEILHNTIDPDRLRAYWAHWTVTMLHWTIRSGDTTAIDLHLDLGEQGPI